MPDEGTEADAPPQVKPFALFLQEQRAGLLHSELSDVLAEASQTVMDTGKPATITVQIKVKKSKLHGAVEVEDLVKTRLPQPDRDAGLFFPDEHGNLSRRDPRQPEIPGIRDASADTTTTARATGTEG